MNDDAMDQKRRQEIIYEMSKDSGYFKRALKVSERNHHRAEEMLLRMHALTASQRMAYQSRCDEDCLRLEARRNLSRICCVVDMDMFFAAVEIRDNPKLKDLPVRFLHLSFHTSWAHFSLIKDIIPVYMYMCYTR
jgi:DNA polymerase kappa